MKIKILTFACVLFAVTWSLSIDAKVSPIECCNENLNEYCKLDPEEIILLSKIIRAESIGESFKDKQWVGSVILNRMAHPNYPSTMWGVVYQKRQFAGIKSKMFEYVIRKDPNYGKLDQDCRDVAMDLLLNGSKLPANVLFYHNEALASKIGSGWIRRLVKKAEYYGTTGKHQYYGL